MIEEMRNDKTEKTFWEIVNQNRKRREGIEKDINKELNRALHKTVRRNRNENKRGERKN